jgi:hypothetical protein
MTMHHLAPVALSGGGCSVMYSALTSRSATCAAAPCAGSRRPGTRQSSQDSWPNTASPHSLHRLGYRVTAVDETVYEDRVEVEIDNPDHHLETYALGDSIYSNGEEVTLDLNYSEPDLELSVDASDLDSEFDPAGVSVEDLGDGVYRVVVPISEDNEREDGRRTIAVASRSSDDELVEDYLQVELRKLPPIPFTVAGGAFVDLGKPPAALVPEGAPMLQGVDSDPTLVTGGTLSLALNWEEDETNPASRILVASENNSGYWVVPVEGTDGTQTLELSLPSLKPAADGSTNNVMVTVTDDSGRAIEWVTHPINQLIVGSGGVQVSLTWDAPVDLDLHVTDPTGRLVDWGAEDPGDGMLDLDSNAECKLDNVNTENIFWEDGKEVAGPYSINVSYYASCEYAETVKYKVAAQICGRVTTYEGEFSEVDASEDPYDMGRLVAQLVMDCTHKVSGKVTYEKREVVTRPGTSMALKPNGKITPARFVPVQAIRSGDDKCLARTVTDANGKYTLRFLNDGDARFTVTAEPRYGKLKPSTRVTECPEFESIASVMKLSGSTVYSAESVEQDGSMNADISGLDIKVKVADDAGAFNVNDVVAQGYNWALTRWAELLPALKVRWELGKDTPLHTSYFDGSSTFYILGKPTDPDEWDDSVISHEFSHFIIDKLSKTDTPGGAHPGRTPPRQAWDEGLASALGADILGRHVYVDSTLNSGVIACAGSCRDLEADSNIQTGTSDGKMNSNIDEFLVASIVHDMLDRANEPHDKLDVSYHNVLGSLFTYLPRSGRANRGATGVDLVDYLDGWRCHDQSLTGLFGDPNSDADLQTLLNDSSVNFPYDFPALTCP